MSDRRHATHSTATRLPLVASRRRPAFVVSAMMLVLASCSADQVSVGSTAPSTALLPTATAPLPSSTAPQPSSTSSTSSTSTSTGVVADESGGFPSELFASLEDEPVTAQLTAELQAVLDESADGFGYTATVIAPAGTWSGASGMANAERAMVPNDQMSIASITKTLVAALVMRLVEAGELSLNDLAADLLPSDLDFDTNDARVIDLLSMRSGISEYFADDDELSEVLTNDRLHIWTTAEKLATVAADRGPVGKHWEYIGTNYLLLGLIIEQVTGRSVAEELRDGVLDGNGYDRLIYQPDERPTEPMAMPLAASAATFGGGRGYLPSIANATMFTAEGAMASDSMTLARWFRALCAGEITSSASLDAMADFGERPGYGIGLLDRNRDYWPGSGAVGHPGQVREGYRSVALCFQDPASVVVVLANGDHDVDTVAGLLVQAANN